MKHITKFLILVISLFLLTACSSKWQVEVELTPEESQAIEVSIKQLKKDIKIWEGPEGEIPWRKIIDLANAYEKLGDYNSSIKLYNSWFNKGHKTKAMINNLGRAYEKVNEYELAIEQYQRIIEEYFDPAYLYDITWAYIRNKDRKKAEKYFNAWQLEHQKTDLQTQQAIKKLREEEKANANE